MDEAMVEAVCISKHKGTIKTPIKKASLREEHGLVDDAHAGKWHRQVSLLAVESITKMQKMGLKVSPGSFGENITTSGITLHTLSLGTKIQINENILLEVTQIGKECHSPCAIGRTIGNCIMPEEGIFARVLRGGEIKPKDKIKVIISNRL
ncbi:MAG: MOSC domain-containing protein [Promethearchaeota archaeon]